MTRNWQPMKAERKAKTRRSGRQRAQTTRRLLVEALEDRRLLSLVSWAVDSDGYWDVAANWLDDQGVSRVPGPGDDVVINRAAGTFVVTHRQDSTSIRSLTAIEQITLSAGQLSVGETAHVADTFRLAGGTLRGATVTTAGSGKLVVTATSTLDSVHLDGDLEMTVAETRLNVRNDLTVDGTLQVGTVNTEARCYLDFKNTQTIDGTGTIALGGNVFNTLIGDGTITLGPELHVQGNGYLSGSANVRYVNLGTITAGASLTISAANFENQGTVQVAGGVIDLTSPSWTSSGTLTATGGATLKLGQLNASWSNAGSIHATASTVNCTGTWSNTGAIDAVNSTVNLDGSYTAIGSVTRSGGTFNLKGNLNNSGRALVLDTNTGSWNVHGATISGGSIATADGEKLMVTSSSIIDGVRLDGDMEVAVAETTLNVRNGLTLNGTMQIGSIDNSARCYLDIRNTPAVNGTGTIVLGGNIFNTLIGDGTITFGPNLHVQGNGYLSGSANVRYVNQGTITAGASLTISAANFENKGTVQVDGGAVDLTSPSWINSGTLTAAGGATLNLGASNSSWSNTGGINVANSTLNLNGSFTSVGTMTRSGGVVNLKGTLNNSGKTVALNSFTGSWNLEGGTITGGTVTIIDGQRLSVVTTGTLQGVALNGDVDVLAGGRLSLRDGLTLDGTLRLTSDDPAKPAHVYLENTQTLAGRGTILFQGPVDHEVTIRASASTVTLGPQWVIRGQGGTLKTQFGDSTYVLLGLICAEDGGTVAVSASQWTNAGTVEARDGATFASWADPANYSGGRLTGGNWKAFAGSSLLMVNSGITNLAANVQFDGAGAQFKLYNGTPALVNLASIAVQGSVTIENGSHLGTSVSLTNSGQLRLGCQSTLTINGDYSQAGTGTLEVVLAGSPATGQFGRLNPSGLATLGGTLRIDVANGYMPEVAHAFAVMRYAGHSGSFSRVEGLLINRVPVFEATLTDATLTVNSLQNAADLAAETVTVPATGTPGQDVTIRYTVRNNQLSPTATAPWVDSLYLSADNTFDLSDKLIGRVEHFGNLAGLSNYTETLTAPLPGVLPGDYRVIVITDSRGLIPDLDRSNNTLSSAGRVSVQVPALLLGTTVTGTITPGQDQYFQLDLGPAADVDITLELATTREAELYVRYAAMPDRSNYALKQVDLFSLQHRLALTNTQAGHYYVLLHGREGAAGGQGYALAARTPTLAVNGISPATGSNVGRVTVTLNGSGFSRDAAVSLLQAAGPAIAASKVTYADATRLVATFNLENVAPANYQVRVNSGGRTAACSLDFTVVETQPGGLEVGLYSPPLIRVGGKATVRISYANTGTVDLPPLVSEIRAQNFKYDADRNRIPVESNMSAPSARWISPLPPGSSIEQVFEYVPPGGENIVTEFSVFVSSWELLRLPWSDLITRPAYISEEAWGPVFDNFVARAGESVSTFGQVLAEDKDYLQRIGAGWETLVCVRAPCFAINDHLNRIVAFELEHADNALPMEILAAAEDAVSPGPGLPLRFDRLYAQPISARYRLGPLGRGWTHTWDMSVNFDGVGNVFILTAGQPRYFLRQPGGTYAAPHGDYAAFTAQPSGYSLIESDGTLFSFSTNGQLRYVQDTNGNRVSLTYGPDGLTRIAHSSGDSFVLAYDGNGRICQLTDHAGRTTTYTYDASSEKLTNVTGPAGTTSYAYVTGQGAAREHALASIAYPDSTHEYLAYDQHGRLVGHGRDGGAEAVTYGYDSPGAMRITDAAGAVRVALYDDAGQLREFTDALGRPVYLNRDQDYNVTSVTVPGTGTYTFAYNTEGHLVKQVNPLGQVIEFTSDPFFGRLQSLRDPRGNTKTFSYDDRGNPVSSTLPDGSSAEFYYDAAGNVIQQVSRQDEAIRYTYDSRGLLTHKYFSDGSHTDYAYDGHGNLITASDGSGTTTMEYDAADRLTKITYPSGCFLAYAYDAGGRRTQMVDQDGFTVNYAYDVAGRLVALTDDVGAAIVDYAYDNVGRLTRKNLGNDTYTTYEYDSAGQLLHLVNQAPDDSINSRFDYTYDTAGRRIGMSTLDGDWTYQYDATTQLTHAVFDSTDPAVLGQDLSYVYDAAGNRIRTILNGVTTEYATNRLDQYTSVGASTYTYDADGNLISKTNGSEVVQYTYNSENRLVSVVSPSGSWTYEYDALGNRSAVIHDGQRVEYVIDPTGLGNVTAAYDGSGGLIADYTHGLGLTSRVEPAAGTVYYDFDAIGSVVGASSLGGVYSGISNYAPFGEPYAYAATDGAAFGFVGQYGVLSDSATLYAMGYRAYDPQLGRFVSYDPLNIAGGSANLYTYAYNQPTMYIDPVGLVASLNDMTPDEIQGHCRDMHTGYTKALANLPAVLPGITYVVLRESAINGMAAALQEATGIPSLSWSGLLSEAAEWAEKRGLIPSYEAVFPKLPIRLDVSASAGSETAQIAPHDPNDMVGPTGFGPDKFVTHNQQLPFQIRFENQASATAPAMIIEITQQLDADLDWSSFELEELGIGSLVVDVPEGRDHYSTRLDLRDTCGLYVDVAAGIDLDTGVVTWSLQAVDPQTADLPLDPLAGFLPPNVSPPAGDGYVTYTIRPKSDSITGTRIDAEAAIVFDWNAPVDTPSLFNTVDAAAPASSVAPLPSVTCSEEFRVAWSGSDDPGGSGVARYDVYVSTDGGPFEPFQQGTSDSSATYPGEFGHSYAFYSVAVDNVGHREATPDTADAQTTLLIGQPPTDITLTGDTLAENQPSGTLVGTLTTADPDSGDRHTYSLPVGFGDNRFFAVNGERVETAGPLDFETKSSYSIKVRSTDQVGLGFEKMFTVTATDIAETMTVTAAHWTAAGVTLTVGPDGKIHLYVTGSDPLADTVPSHAAGMVTAISVTGRDNANDQLTVDFSGGNPIPSGGLMFDGGVGGHDTFQLTGGTFGTVVHQFTGAGAGNVDLDNDGTPDLCYRGLEPFLMASDIAALELDITQAGIADAVLRDYTGAGDSGHSELAFTAHTGEDFQFQSPTSSLKIITHGGSTVSISGFDAAFTAPGLIFEDTSGTASRFALSTGEVIPNAVDVTVTDNAVFDLNGQTETIDGLNGTGTVDNAAAGTAGLVLGSGGAGGTFSGTLQDTGGHLSLIKTGAGTLTLSGSNGHAGGTTIIGGILRIGSGTALGTGSVTMQGVGGGQLDLNGQTIVNTVIPGYTATGPGNAGCLVNSNTATPGVINGPVQLGGNNYTGGNGDITFNGLVTGGVSTGNAYAIFKQGTGTMTFSRPDNTFDGWFYIVGGTVAVTKLNNLGNPSSLGQATSALTNRIRFDWGSGTLRYLGSTASTSDREFVLGVTSNVIDASGTSPAATLTLTGPTNVGPLTLTGTNTGPNTFQGTLSGSTSLTKTGTGTWMVSGNNTYSGATTISQGMLHLGHTNALGTTAGTTTVQAGATLNLSGQTGVPEGVNLNGFGVGGNGALINSSTAAAGISGGIYAGSNTSLVNNGGKITLAGTVATNAWQLTLDGSGDIDKTVVGFTISAGGELIKNGSGTLTSADSTNINVGPGAKYTHHMGTTTISGGYGLNVSGSSVGDGVVTQTGGTINAKGSYCIIGSNGGNSGGKGILNMQGGMLNVNGTFYSAWVGNGQINQTGGIVQVANFDSATDGGHGEYHLRGGTLTATGHAHLGYRAGTATDFVQSGGSASFPTLVLGGIGSGGTGNYTINTNDGTSTLTVGTGGLFVGYSGTGIGNFYVNGGTVTVNGDLMIGRDATTSGTVTQTSGTVTLGATRTLRFGNGTSAAGTCNLNGGTLTLANIAYSSTATQHFNFGGGTLQANGALATAMPVPINAGGGTVDTNGNSVALNGVLDGTGGLTKTGTGTLTLNAANTYSGPTTVSQGALLVNGSTAAGSAVAVNDTGTLGGTGTAAGPVTVNSGGTITGATDGTVGRLTVGSLAFNGGTYWADISGDTADTITTSGAINLQAPTQGIFTVGSVGGSTTAGHVFTLINNTQASNAIVAPPLSGAPEGSSTTVNGKTAVYSYAGGADGNDFTLTVASPPQVESVVINAGLSGSASQRSMVKNVTVTFDTLVTIASGAFALSRRAADGTVTPITSFAATESTTDGKTVVTLTFPKANGFVGGSLADGNYLLTIDDEKVHAGGATLQGDGSPNGDYCFGDREIDNFFRLFGDGNGDRRVDGAAGSVDLSMFAATYGRRAGQAGFNEAFDYDGDGDVDGTDLAWFRAQRNKTMWFS